MAVTIKDVAKKAGVNPSTVSRVLSNAPEISEKTKILVKKAIDELGYTKHAAAQILSSGRINTIGIVFPPVSGKSNQPFYMKILTAINGFAQAENHSVAIATGNTEELLKKQVEMLYRERRVDGFILLYAGKKDSIREFLMAEKVPFVMVGTPQEAQNELVYVDNDNILLGREAVKHLSNLGHQNVTFVTDTTEGEVFDERYQGFLEECKLSNLTGTLVKFDENFTVTNETALVVIDDVLALKTFAKLKAQNLTIPDDLSIITFNNSDFSQITHPYLTTFDINVEQLGKAAVEQFISLSKDKNSYNKIIVPFDLIVRESTGKARK